MADFSPRGVLTPPYIPPTISDLPQDLKTLHPPALRTRPTSPLRCVFRADRQSKATHAFPGSAAAADHDAPPGLPPSRESAGRPPVTQRAAADDPNSPLRSIAPNLR